MENEALLAEARAHREDWYAGCGNDRTVKLFDRLTDALQGSSARTEFREVHVRNQDAVIAQRTAEVEALTSALRAVADYGQDLMNRPGQTWDSIHGRHLRNLLSVIAPFALTPPQNGEER